MNDASKTLDYASDADVRHVPRWWHEPAILPICFAETYAVAGIACSITLCVSPEYAKAGGTSWGEVALIGIAGSSLVAFILSIVMMAAYASISSRRAPLKIVFLSLRSGAAVAMIAWLAGGLIGCGWAIASPDSFLRAIEVADRPMPNRVAAWGFASMSMVGLTFGAIAAAVVAVAMFAIRWRRFPTT